MHPNASRFGSHVADHLGIALITFQLQGDVALGLLSELRGASAASQRSWAASSEPLSKFS